jgi:hypothetical protein
VNVLLLTLLVIQSIRSQRKALGLPFNANPSGI